MNKPTGEKKYMNADKNKGVDFLLLLQNQDSKKIINKLAKERKILVNKFKQPKSKTIRIPIELYNDFKKTGNGDIKKGMIKTILLRRAFENQSDDSIELNIVMRDCEQMMKHIELFFPELYNNGISNLPAFIRKILQTGKVDVSFLNGSDNSEN